VPVYGYADEVISFFTFKYLKHFTEEPPLQPLFPHVVPYVQSNNYYGENSMSLPVLIKYAASIAPTAAHV
jgi:hypothetical protein